MKYKLLLLLSLASLSLASCSILEDNQGSTGTIYPTTNNPSPSTKPSIKPSEEETSTSDKATTKPSGDTPDTMVLNILEFNDLHGHVEQQNGMYGISNAAYLVDQIRNEDELDNTILLAAGDMFQETAIARLSYGRVVIDCMNSMGFDMMHLGNHEFDWTLDKCLEFWDNDPSNGEASFPLLNANVVTDKNELVVDPSRNILPSTIIEREGLKIGLIGLMGDVYSSILASMSKGYKFLASNSEIERIVLAEGKKLKDNGADIIIASIHDGNQESVYSYKVNEILSKLKYNDEYLIDAVINGHTHSEVKGEFVRPGGASMPAIQSQLYYPNSGTLKAFGRIDLKIDMKTKRVIGSEASHVKVSSAAANYDKDVESIVDSYYEASKDILDEVYCNNLKPFKRQKQAGEWVCNLGMSAAKANACIINTGGLRGEVPSGMIGFKEIYNFNPFDNRLIKMEIKGYDLKRFIDGNSKYYYYTTDTGYIDQDKTYTLAIIDYVFYSKYFNSYRPKVYEETDIVLRDLMIKELRYYKNTGFNIYEDYNNIHI